MTVIQQDPGIKGSQHCHRSFRHHDRGGHQHRHLCHHWHNTLQQACKGCVADRWTSGTTAGGGAVAATTTCHAAAAAAAAGLLLLLLLLVLLPLWRLRLLWPAAMSWHLCCSTL
jgi:hypothetical protein